MTTLTKIKGKPDSHIEPGYWVRGMFCSKLKEGDRVYLTGSITDSDGNRWFDWFQTTEVLEIDNRLNGEVYVTTKNSRWKVETEKI
jgi:hypothetical protein